MDTLRCQFTTSPPGLPQSYCFSTNQKARKIGKGEGKKTKPESSTNNDYNALHLGKNSNEAPPLGVTLRFTITVLHKILFRSHVFYRETELNTFLKGAEAWPRFARIFKQNGLKVWANFGKIQAKTWASVYIKKKFIYVLWSWIKILF